MVLPAAVRLLSYLQIPLPLPQQRLSLSRLQLPLLSHLQNPPHLVRLSASLTLLLLLLQLLQPLPSLWLFLRPLLLLILLAFASLIPLLLLWQLLQLSPSLLLFLRPLLLLILLAFASLMPRFRFCGCCGFRLCFNFFLVRYFF